MSSTGTQAIGLKSLSARINNIERVIGEDVGNVGQFVSSAVIDVKNQQYLKLSNDISIFVDNFRKYIPDNVDAYHDAVEIVTCGVKYVEKNIKTLAKVMGKKISSDFKLDTCLKLVKEITGDKFNDQFLINTINHIVSLVCTKCKLLK